MRLFYAAFLSRENIDAYQSLVKELVAGAQGALRSVPPGTQHLTLGFLGEIAEPDVTHCTDVLALAESTAPIPISLAPPQILSARKSPRLIKADVYEGSERVSALQELLRVGLLKRLPRLEIRPHPPHVTLARFKKTAGRDAGRRVADLISRREERSLVRTDLLDRVQLVRSTLTPRGPLYETVAQSLLRS
jgi:2'-5' RNA ligase